MISDEVEVFALFNKNIPTAAAPQQHVRNFMQVSDPRDRRRRRRPLFSRVLLEFYFTIIRLITINKFLSLKPRVRCQQRQVNLRKT